MQKKHWMKIHTYLSLFFLPMCLIYVLTGVGYIFDLKDSAGAKTQNLALVGELNESDLSDLKLAESAIINTLKENNLKIPSNTTLRSQKGNLTMGGIKYSVTLQKGKDGAFEVKTMERSIYGTLVLMHKAKGAAYFNALAVGFAISLTLFYLSGLIMTSFCKKNRKSAFATLGVGFLITVIAIFLSV